MNEQDGRAFGWRPDVPDHRDHFYGAQRAAQRAAVAAEPLPVSVNLSDRAPPVRDQLRLGACTGFAVTAMCALKVPGDYSPLFTYYVERVYEHTTKWDSGAYLRDGIKSIYKVGAAHESWWPYVPTKFATKPRINAYRDAHKNLFAEYLRLVTTAEMMQCLAEGFPFVFGFSVYDSFMSNAVANTGEVPLPLMSERMLGGHAVVCVGYDQTTQRFLCQNSWGPEWGLAGFFTMPFAYLGNQTLSDDFWMVR